jgi:membrane associated rhomboid family serine protease
VSVAIVVSCALAFAFTWVLPEDPTGDAAVEQVFDQWSEHPYLELDPALIEQNLNDHGKQMVEKYRRTGPQAASSEEERAEQQAQLDASIATMKRAREGSWLRRLSLVPQRGLSQVGWLTHMFLHFGWLHLIGNLFFFYLCGPLLEDIWGRRNFGAFYVAGGLVAAVAHYLIDRHSPSTMAGASGAIAACMGAFAVRFSTRKIRIGYLIFFLRIFRGTFSLPAWVCGLLWFGSEVLDFFVAGGDSGVAVMAHIGGFAFGAAVAVSLKSSGVEERFIAPAVEAAHTRAQHPALEQGQAALDRGDRAAAAGFFRQVLAARPDDPDAEVGLARIELHDEGTVPAATTRLERLFTRLLARNEGSLVVHYCRELGPLLPSGAFRPPFAFRLADAIAAGVEGDRPLAVPLYERAATAGGLIAAKALVRAAQVIAASGGDKEQLRTYVESASSHPQLTPDLRSALAAIEGRHVPVKVKWQDAPPSEEGKSASPRPPRQLSAEGTLEAVEPTTDEHEVDPAAVMQGPPPQNTVRMSPEPRPARRDPATVRVVPLDESSPPTQQVSGAVAAGLLAKMNEPLEVEPREVTRPISPELLAQVTAAAEADARREVTRPILPEEMSLAPELSEERPTAQLSAGLERAPAELPPEPVTQQESSPLGLKVGKNLARRDSQHTVMTEVPAPPPQPALVQPQPEVAALAPHAEPEPPALSMPAPVSLPSSRVGSLVTGTLQAVAREPSPPALVEVHASRLVSMDEYGLRLESAHGPASLSYDQVLGVGVGRIPEGDRPALATDLILAWNDGTHPASAIRLSSRGLHLENIYPGVPAGEAYHYFLGYLLERSNAYLLPDAEGIWNKQYPRFASSTEFEEAIYRPR